MAIVLGSGLQITSTDAVDTRMVMTKAEMLAIKGSKMPDNYICMCKDDGKLYVYNKANEADPTIGKFKSYEDVMDLDEALTKQLSDPTKKAAFADTLSDVIPDSLKGALDTQTIESGIEVDTDGNILIKTLTEQEIHDVLD